MGSLTPNRGFYKPVTGDVAWGALVNANWNILNTAASSNLGFYNPVPGEFNVTAHMVSNWTIVSSHWPTVTILNTPMYSPGWGDDWNANWDALDLSLGPVVYPSIKGLDVVLLSAY